MSDEPKLGDDEAAQRPWFMRGGERRPHVDHVDANKLFPEDAQGEDR